LVDVVSSGKACCVCHEGREGGRREGGREGGREGRREEGREGGRGVLCSRRGYREHRVNDNRVGLHHHDDMLYLPYDMDVQHNTSIS
jgi:hypothetical protein